MCVIQGDTKTVADTQIFCFPACNGKDQVTVYSNEVHMNNPQDNNNAMILPIPRGYEQFKMVDLTKDPDLFKNLNRCFPSVIQMSTRNGSSLSAAANSADYLAVKRCGSYEFSLVPSVQDFRRINPTVFQLNKDVEQLLLDKYPLGFAFLVCKIRQNTKFHPLAYMHPLQPDGRLFVPTLHFHQGHQGAQAYSADWDHDIYVLGNNTLGQAAVSLDGLRSVASLRPYMSANDPEKLRKLEINGHFENKDIMVPVSVQRSVFQTLLSFF